MDEPLSVNEGLRLWREGKLPGMQAPTEDVRTKGPCDVSAEFPRLGTVAKDIHFVSRSLPRNWRANGKPLAKDYVTEGKLKGAPRFSSRRELNEAIARHNGETDCTLSYGELPLPEGEGE